MPCSVPAIILFLVFIAGPLVGAIVLSFYEWDLLTDAKFVGLDNYRKLFTDETALAAVRNTFVFAFWSLVTHIGLGLLLALMVQRTIPGVLKYLFRTAIFFPVIMSWASVSLIWLFILDPNFGFINYYLDKLGIPTKSWLLMPDTAMPAIIIVDWWKTIGFTFILLLAGLQGVPAHLHEAAKIDGAGAMRRFWDITLPMLSPTLFLTAILTFIGAFQIFEPMYIMTGAVRSTHGQHRDGDLRNRVQALRDGVCLGDGDRRVRRDHDCHPDPDAPEPVLGVLRVTPPFTIA